MRRAIIFLFFLPGFVTISNAETCTISGPENGFFIVEAGDKTYKALSGQNYEKLKSQVKKDSETINKLRKQLEDTSSAVKDYMDLTDKYEQLRKENVTLTEKYNKTFSDSVSLIENYKESTAKSLELNENYNQLALKFDDLAGKYRGVAVDRTSFIRFDVAAGVTSNDGDAKLAAIFGVGISKLKIWGFLQEDNSGALIGTSFNF